MRAPGQARVLLLAAFQAGAVGSFECLAAQTGVPQAQVRNTLKNLRREGRVDMPERRPRGGRGAGRGVYAAANDEVLAFDALRFVCEVWS